MLEIQQAGIGLQHCGCRVAKALCCIDLLLQLCQGYLHRCTFGRKHFTLTLCIEIRSFATIRYLKGMATGCAQTLWGLTLVSNLLSYLDCSKERPNWSLGHLILSVICFALLFLQRMSSGKSCLAAT